MFRNHMVDLSKNDLAIRKPSEGEETQTDSSELSLIFISAL